MLIISFGLYVFHKAFQLYCSVSLDGITRMWWT